MKSKQALRLGILACIIEAVIIILNQLLGQALLVLLPFPLMIYAAIFSIQETLIIMGLCSLIGFVFGFTPMFMAVWGYGLIGLIAIISLKKRYPLYQQYLLMLTVAVPFNLLMIFTFTSFFGVDYYELVNNFGVLLAAFLIAATVFVELFIIRQGFLLLNYTLKVHGK